MSAYNHRLLIRNGRIYDPGRGIDRRGDLAMYKDRIVDTLPDDGTDLMVIDAEGDLVLPGLIDFHMHLGYGSSEYGIDTDAFCLPNGVTSAVDAGTKGSGNIHQMAMETIPRAATNIKCLLNLSTTGMGTYQYHENLDPQHFDRERIRFCFEKYPDILIGLKIRLMTSTLPDFERTGLAPLVRALEIAEDLGVFLAVHITNPPCPYKEIVDLLRPGDILVHPFQGVGQTILTGSGTIEPSIWAAKERGVLLDLAGARTNQTYPIAQQALATGLLPDIFSSDLTRDSIYMKPVFSLPYILSAYRSLGVPLANLIKGCTTQPARLMHQEDEIGTLAAGSLADVCILKEQKNEREFVDWFGNAFTGDTLYKPRVTIKDGRVVYMDMDVKQTMVRR